MTSNGLGLFGYGARDKPTVQDAWNIYTRGIQYNDQLHHDETIKANRNMVLGRQWEGVVSNGLPTPVFNVLKRVVGYVTATITSENIAVNATKMGNEKEPDEMVSCTEVANAEFISIIERNDLLKQIRRFTRSAAIDGDAAIHVYWDDEFETGNKAKGCIRTEVLPSETIMFGNPSTPDVQSQPYITISKREIVRNVQIKAKNNGLPYKNVYSTGNNSNSIDQAKLDLSNEKCTVLLTYWKDEKGHVWEFESTETAVITEPVDLGITMYPIVWLPWDEIADCYHGEAMVTGLIPNQVFINRAWAMTMISITRSAFSKVIFDKTRIKQWDNRVGGAIGIQGGDVNTAARIIEPAPISPQVSELISLCTTQTQDSMGANAAALGDIRPDNTSAILSLQKAAATPHETTKRNLYSAIEDIFRIALDYMGEYYGKRILLVPTPAKVASMYEFAQMEAPEYVEVEYDFKFFSKHSIQIKLDVGASSYFSEIASMQTLDNLLINKQIDIVEYLERIPEGQIPNKGGLIAEKKKQKQQQESMMAQMAAQQNAQPQVQQSVDAENNINAADDAPEVKGGSGYSHLQRMINSGVA